MTSSWLAGHNYPVKAGLVYIAEEYVYSCAVDYVFGNQVGKEGCFINPCKDDLQLNYYADFFGFPKAVVQRATFDLKFKVTCGSPRTTGRFNPQNMPSQVLG